MADSESSKKPAKQPDLYKAQVHVRWRNEKSHVYNDIFGGDVVTFDEGDFGGGRAMSSLEDVLARGLFVPFDPSKPVTAEDMSRDEMLEYLINAGKGEGLSHSMTAEALRPLAAAHLLEQQKAAAVLRLEGKA